MKHIFYLFVLLEASTNDTFYLSDYLDEFTYISIGISSYQARYMPATIDANGWNMSKELLKHKSLQ